MFAAPRLTGWVSGLPTNASAAGFVMPLTLDGAISGWVCNLDDPTASLRLDFSVGGVAVGSASATGLFFNDKPQGAAGAHAPIPPPAPSVLRAGFIFYLPDSALTGANSTLTMIAVDPSTNRSAPFRPGAAALADTLQLALRPRISPHTPTVGSRCLGMARCPSPGDALSFGPPWFDPNPKGWTDTTEDLFQLWNCTAPEGGYDTIVRLSILPYALRPGAADGTPGDRYHHRGFAKDSVHLAEAETLAEGGPVLHFSATRSGIPGAPGRLIGEGARTASAWGLKKAVFNRAANEWRIYDQLDEPNSGYGASFCLFL